MWFNGKHIFIQYHTSAYISKRFLFVNMIFCMVVSTPSFYVYHGRSVKSSHLPLPLLSAKCFFQADNKESTNTLHYWSYVRRIHWRLINKQHTGMRVGQLCGTKYSHVTWRDSAVPQYLTQLFHIYRITHYLFYVVSKSVILFLPRCLDSKKGHIVSLYVVNSKFLVLAAIIASDFM